MQRQTVWTLIITSVAGFMASLDNLVVTTALPVIKQDLGGGIEELEWTVNSYTLTFAVLMLLGAALGDRFGRRRMFLAGLAVFTVSSSAAALSADVGQLVAARAVQGAGAAVLMPLTLTLLTTAVPAERRGMAFGIWGAVNGLAVAAGSLVGGAVVDYLSWPWIFWLNVPIGLLLLPLARLRLAESHGPSARLDVVGTVLASLGLLGVVLGLVQGGSEGWGSARILTEFTLGGLLLVAFVLWELGTDEPMLPMRLFRSRAFSAVNAASLLMFLGLFGSLFLLSQFLQMVQGYSPLEAGLRVLPMTGMPMIVAPVAGRLADRIGGRPIVAVGMLLQALGLAWFALIATPEVAYLLQVPGLIVTGIGMALFFSPVATLVMGSVAPAEQGIASGANNALRQLGGVLGVAVMGAVFTAQGGYGTPQHFVDGLVPALWVGAGAVALAVVATVLVPARKPGKAPADAASAPTPASVTVH